MSFSNAAKLKAAIKKIAVDSGVTAQGVLQKYVLERFLCRLAKSDYRRNFILKGGFLTSSLVGVAMRTTMDIDATATGFNMDQTNLGKILHSICSEDLQDGFTFSLDRVEDTKALHNTMSSRGNLMLLDRFEEIMDEVKSDEKMKQRWESYQKEYAFAAGRTFLEVCDSALELLNVAGKNRQN